jgi:hypothetical protein
MPRVRRGPNGPRSSAAGKKGTNKRTPHKGAGTSGNSHNAQLLPRTRGRYGGTTRRRGKKY